MITIEALVPLNPELRRYAAQPEMDPLTETDALQEAQLLDIRFDALRSRIGLIFELRTSLQLREGNTGVMVAHGVRDVAWSVSQRSTLLTAWNVIESLPKPVDGLFSINLRLWPQGKLSLTSESAAFFTGNVPELTLIPDYGQDDDRTIQANLAKWNSVFTPIHAVFLDSTVSSP